MKKIFIAMSLLSVLFTGVKAADDGYRRTWDFTKGWSQETIEKLQNDPSNWEVQTTGFQNNPTAMTANATPWVMVDGEKEPIAELVGMTINSNLAKAKHCQICTTGSGLADVPCFWLNGKGDAVSVKVPAGENVRFGYTAHGANDRGFKCNAGFADANGTTQFTNADNQQIHEVELINSNTEESTLTLTTVNGGSHIYYIIIGQGDEEEQVDPKNYNVAYVYDATYNGAKDASQIPFGYASHGGLADGDPLYTALDDNFNMTALDVNCAEIKALSVAEFNDSLMKFDAVVLSEAVGSGNTYAKGMLEVINKVPMVNLKSFMYKAAAWKVGAGVNPSPLATTVHVGEDYLDHALFEEVNIDDDGNIQLFNGSEVPGGNLVQGYTVTEGSLFEGDDVLATVGETNAIHIHSNRNQYILLPLSSDNLLVGEDWNVTDDAQKLLVNAVKLVAVTKTKVTPVAKPTITQIYGDGVTSVVLSCTNKAAKIYYTLDGTDPTTASTLYTDTFKVTADGVEVKALAVAQGYDDSEIASATVIIKTQTVAPVLAVDGETFTITGEGDLYYNIIGANTVEKSVKYTEPVQAPFDCTVTAFAVETDKLPSVVVSAEVTTSNIYKYEIAHLNFKEAWVKDKDGSAVSKGDLNKKFPFFLDEGETSEHQMVIPASDGSDSIAYYSDSVMTYSTLTEGNAWTVSTNGARIAYSTDGNEGVISVVGGTAYGAADAFSALLFTKNAFTFSEINHSRDAEFVKPSITSGQKYPQPFKLTAVIMGCLGSGANQSPEYRKSEGEDIIYQRMEVLISKDKENWTLVDTISTSCNKMAEAVSVLCEGTDEVYVRLQAITPLGTSSSSDRKINLNDVYIFSNNETLGIEAIADKEAVKSDAIYDLMGRRIVKKAAGQLYIENGKKVIVR